jgi:hypothetical protein
MSEDLDFEITDELIDQIQEIVKKDDKKFVDAMKQLNIERGGGRWRKLSKALHDKYPDLRKKQPRPNGTDLTLENLNRCFNVAQVDRLIVVAHSFLAKAQDRKALLSKQ